MPTKEQIILYINSSNAKDKYRAAAKHFGITLGKLRGLLA